MVSSICKEKILLQSQMWKECFNADIPQQKDQDTQIANSGHGKDSRKRESEDHLMLPALVKVLGR